MSTKPALRLSEDQLTALKDSFKTFDIDGNGTLSPQEITYFLQNFGQAPTPAQVDEIMKRVDVDRNGSIDFDEFVNLMAARSEVTGSTLDEESDLREAFKMFDKDGNGTINAEELKLTMRNIGVYLTDEELDLMMKEADEDKNGVIDFQEFRRVIMAPAMLPSGQTPLARN
ncbi:hypothetical protein NP233_g2889 [Leucocoprinus birnbaumii]|uniref:EF-hand domain-containing protein n=1 Tax=Leucocoprinus birnbaumii TaxID=56174 RepID=A0AAD5W1C5_9AGAR|nr:hypothetical protein NP233_g2889 [Leucocoprinus birnbaumii]